MNCLVDAQLPWRLAEFLIANGHKTLHTRDLPDGNASTDEDLIRLSVSEERILLTKDSDFVDSMILRRVPWKLLLISTGNICNDDLIEILGNVLDEIETAFVTSTYIELGRDSLVIHF